MHEAQAVMRAAPFEMCPEVAGGVASLKGLRITGGWARQVKKRIGRIAGCTHVTHLLLGPMATTAYQAIRPRRTKSGPSRKSGKRPEVLGTCHAFDPEGPLVKEFWPDFYTGT